MKVRQLLLSSTLGLLAIFCSAPSKAEAIFASVKSLGMAATAVAYPQDSFAVAYNPAGMIAVGNRADIEGGWVHDQGHARVFGNLAPIPPYEPQANGHFNLMRRHDYGVGNAGFNTDWCTNICDCWDLHWTFGVALFNRDFQKATLNKIQPLFGTSKAGIEYVHEELATSVSFGICDGHALGISLDWHIARVKVNGVQNFNNPDFTSHPGHVSNKGYNYSHGVGFTVGYYGQLADWLSIGATYRPKTYMDRYKKYDGFFAEHGKIDIPEKISGGIAVDPWPCLTICFDVEHLRWHGIKALSNKLIMDEEFFIANPLGSDNGTGFGFHNQTFYRIGAEYRLSDALTVRAGFRHVNALFSRSQTATNTLIDDVVLNYITCGFTWNWCNCGEFSGFYAHGFEHSIHGRHDIPDFLGGGNVNISETKDVLGFALAWKW